MSKITNLNTSAPSAAEPVALAQAIAAPAANGVTMIDDRNASVRDAGGRLIKVRRLSARATGADNSNERYVGYATLASSVTEIDGLPVHFPFNTTQLEALVQRLDDEGLAAAARALIAVTPGMGDDSADAVRNL